MSTETNVEEVIDPEKVKVWEEQGQKTKVQIADNSGHSSSGEVFIKEWNKGERLRRAIFWDTVLWGIAVFCVLIPILHFVLVPLFLILGPIIGYKAYKQTSVVLGGFGPCPQCKKMLPIEKSKEDWPLSDLCTNCQTAVKISLTGK